jgi:Ca-activated chloride channel family protein
MTRRILSIFFLSLALLAPYVSAQSDVRKLSRSERKDRIKSLNDKYRQFLSEVEPIMHPEELDTFLQLESDAQRDLYIEDFWRRRAVAQRISVAEVRERYYNALRTAKEKYKSLASDRARIYIVQGPPIEVKEYGDPSCHLIQPLEVWTYGFIPSLGHNVRLIFYKPHSGFDYRLWQPAHMDQEGLAELISTEVMTIAQENVAVALNRVFGPCIRTARSITPETHLECECGNGYEILKLIQSGQISQMEANKAFLPPPVNPEDVKKILHSVVIANPNAAKLAAQISVDFPAKQRSRTDTRMTILMPRSQLTLKEVGGVKLYSVDVVGEVLKDDQLFENYRYRFDYPPETGEQIAAVIDRYLPPGRYQSRIRIADLNANAQAILENTIEVPALESSGSVATSGMEEGSKLRIVPLPDELLRGLQHIEAITTGDVKAVEYYLDGKKMVTKRNPPYVFDVDLGDVPTVHRIRVNALNDQGAFIGGDEIVVNEGNAPFRVRIVSPRVAVNVRGKTRVEMNVVIPEDKKLDRIELYLNETRLATLFGPPYVQTVDVPPGIGYLRAVASLKESDQTPVEDVVMINSPQYMEELNVHLIELPTTVIRDGRPLNDLGESAFKVLDEGKPVKIAKFERVTNLPLSIGLAIDTSASMQPRIADAQKAAAQFLSTVMKKGDKAFLVSFDIQPMMAQRWSSDVAAVNAGLAKLRTDESTALYDAIIYSLYNFVGVKGQKALIVVTDGKDTSSKYPFDQALDYARRAGVPIYGIGIGIGAAEVDVRYRFGKFCGETGGNVYYIDQASDLHRIYDAIQNELRSQYILAFYPPEGVKPGSKWHEVTVQVSEGKAKTIRGYYP